MTIPGIDSVGEPVEDWMTQLSVGIQNSVERINTVAMVILNLATLIFLPASYLTGLAISVCVNATDMALGDPLSTFFNRFVPSDPVQKLTLLGAMALTSQLIYPPLFGFSMGFSTGRDLTEQTAKLIAKIR